MSENRATYRVDKSALSKIDEFKNLDCARLFSDPDYVPPTVDELSALIALAGWSQSKVAQITGVTYNPKKGSTTVRKWKTPADKPEHRDIPYSAWRLLLINAGVVAI